MKKLVLFAVLFFLMLIGCQSAEVTGGKIHLQEGRYDRAIEQFEEAAKKNPDDPKPIVSIAIAQYMKKNYRESVKNLTKALELDKEGTEAEIKTYEDKLKTEDLQWQIFYNGSTDYLSTDLEKAKELAKKSLEVETPDKKSLSYNLLAHIMVKEGKLEEAEGYFNKSIEANENNIEPYINLGRIYLTKRQEDEALEYLNSAVDIDSTKVEVYELIGQAYLLKEDYGKAIEALKNALDATGENPEILYNLMVAYYENGDYSKTEELAKKILAFDKVRPFVLTSTYNILGNTYQTEGEYEKAINVMKESINKGVNDCNAYSIIAQSYYKLGETKESSDWSERWEECEKTE